jgi:hypothetical protein
VIAAVIVRLPMAGRPVAVPVLAKLVIKGMTSAYGCGWAAAWRRCWPGACRPGYPRRGRRRLRRERAGGTSAGHHLDYPAAQGRRSVRATPGPYRAAGTALPKAMSCRPWPGCPPTVSAPDGHGMILIERCVDIEDTTYRVISVGLDP